MLPSGPHLLAPVLHSRSLHVNGLTHILNRRDAQWQCVISGAYLERHGSFCLCALLGHMLRGKQTVMLWGHSSSHMERHMASHWVGQHWAGRHLSPSSLKQILQHESHPQVTMALGGILIMTLWDALSKSPPATWPPNSWPPETVQNNIYCCFKSLSVGVIF